MRKADDGAPLTVDTVLEAHEILMKGACEDRACEVPLHRGLRTHPCCAGQHAYPEGNPDVLRANLAQIVGVYEEAMSSAATGQLERLVHAPARLFYDVITLHPFSNGNGRLCRLLLSYAVMRAGVPFPVTLSSGHRKSRKHYLHAIMRARRPAGASHLAELNTLTLMSIEACVNNFLTNYRFWQHGSRPGS
jgi:Fic family protein